MSSSQNAHPRSQFSTQIARIEPVMHDRAEVARHRCCRVAPARLTIFCSDCLRTARSTTSSSNFAITTDTKPADLPAISTGGSANDSSTPLFPSITDTIDIVIDGNNVRSLRENAAAKLYAALSSDRTPKPFEIVQAPRRRRRFSRRTACSTSRSTRSRTSTERPDQGAAGSRNAFNRSDSQRPGESAIFCSARH